MRRSLLPTALAATLFLACLAPAQAAPETDAPKVPHASTDPVKKELTAVIDSQLAAFRANDYAKAYTFAATELKGMFNVSDFEKMVKAGYPIIAHSSDAEYGIIFDTGEEAVVNVRVRSDEKRSVLEYQYLLKKEPGGWKIGGVSEVKAEGLSA